MPAFANMLCFAGILVAVILTAVLIRLFVWAALVRFLKGVPTWLYGTVFCLAAIILLVELCAGLLRSIAWVGHLLSLATTAYLFGLVTRKFLLDRLVRYLRPTGIYFTNLLLLLSIGVLGCGWLIYYSDWFEVIGGLLGLGGAFAWLAFISNMLTESRVDEMKDWFDKAILGRSENLAVFASVLLFEILLPALFLGAIQVTAVQAESDLGVRIYPSLEKPGEPRRLPAGGEIRAVHWTTWWSPSECVVDVIGYPDRLEKLHPLARLDFRVPSSFRRPVIRIHPSSDLSELLKHYHLKDPVLTVTVERDKKSEEIGKKKDYEGEGVWAGCDEDVPVPQPLKDAWQVELKSTNKEEYLYSWLQSEKIDGKRYEFRNGDRVILELSASDQHVAAKADTLVRAVTGENFVTEVILDVPRPTPSVTNSGTATN